MASETERFQRLTAEGENGCIEWQGFKSRGYGQFVRKIDGRWKTCKAHRYAWEAVFGDPGEMHVLHKCDNPACVNPEHLFLGTHQDNMRDREAKGRFPTGLNHTNAKLTDQEVREIRQSPMTGSQLARAYGVTRTLIYSIKSGKRRRGTQ